MVAKLVEVSETDRAANYAELEAISVSAGFIESASKRVLPQEYLKVLKKASEALAKYGNKALFSEIVAAELDYRRYDFREMESMKSVMSDVYAVWVDKDAIVKREDNLLASPENRIGWEDEFARAAARVICDANDLVSIDDDSKIYSFMNDKDVIAAFDVREESWYDEGFGTRDVAIKGYVADVMLSDGVFAKARFEGNVSELMMTILSSALRK